MTSNPRSSRAAYRLLAESQQDRSRNVCQNVTETNAAILTELVAVGGVAAVLVALGEVLDLFLGEIDVDRFSFST
ncbi:hypothetical protein ACLF6K_09325 [Streptomyces xanthophaeus]|uniref:hypothetical protein n=1 Tax=Streptomyces xanthophaeus TaxID=67385 RepID=UPI00399020EA